jgi:hypothetical protein
MTGALVLPNQTVIGAPAATSVNFGTAGTGLTGHTNTVSIGTAGTTRLTVGNADTQFFNRIYATAGAVGAAAIHFGTSNTGFYGGAAPDIRATVGGANKFILSASALTLTVPVILPADPTANLEAATKQYVDASKRVNPRVSSAASGDITADISAFDQYVRTGLTAAIAINAPTGTPVNGNKLIFRLKDNGTGRALAWNAIFRAVGLTIPLTTVANKIVYVGAIYNSDETKWDVVAVSAEA